MELTHTPDAAHPPTPSWVIDQSILEQLLGSFHQALATHWPHSLLAYSFKTNSLPWLISFMRDRGAWAEVVSDTEYELALALGYTPDRIVYNGPIKTRESLRSAVLDGAIVNLDAKREVIWAAELARGLPERDIAVGLRVNWSLEDWAPDESITDGDGSRFGFNVDNGEFDDAVQLLHDAGARVAGVHMHRNSKHQSVDVYRASASVAADLIRTHGLDLDWVDVGGGFFGGLNISPSFDDYVRAVKDILDSVIDIERTRLIVEPGASLVALPFEFHAEVLDVKDIDGRRHVVTNTSRIDIDPRYRRQRPFQTAVEPDSAAPVMAEQHLGGFTCMEDDRIMVMRDERKLQIGDRIIFYRVGGYTMCFRPLFIEFLPEVYVRNDGELTRVRRRWGVQDFLQGNSWEEAGELVSTDSCSVAVT